MNRRLIVASALALSLSLLGAPVSVRAQSASGGAAPAAQAAPVTAHRAPYNWL